jgi:hypothetical protein
MHARTIVSVGLPKFFTYSKLISIRFAGGMRTTWLLLKLATRRLVYGQHQLSIPVTGYLRYDAKRETAMDAALNNLDLQCSVIN